MNEMFSPSRFLRLFLQSFMSHKYAFEFIKENRIWKGLNEYQWVVRLLIGLGVAFSVFMLIHDFSKVGSLEDLGKEVFMDSGSKYMLLIILEVVIFHCSVKTLNILKGENKIPTFKDFVEAEKRMIHVSIRLFIIEFITIMVVQTVLEMIFLGFISSLVKYLIQFYFIGFLFIDNYNEQYGQTIKESTVTVQSYSGVAVGIGMVAFILFKIPLLGAILAPILGAVAATIFMENLGVHSDEERQLHHELVDSISFSKISK